MISIRLLTRAATATFAFLAIISIIPLRAQDRVRAMPGYEQFARMQPLIPGAVVSGAAQNVRWADDGRSLTYTAAGKTFRFDLASTTAAEGEDAPPAAGGRGPGGRGATSPPGGGRSGGMEQAQTEMTAGPIAGCPLGLAARGRQADCVIAPNQKLKAFYRNRNLWIANFDGSGEKQVTTDGSEQARIKYGTGTWVYGEELGQTTAIWWSPDSTRVSFYRFDEGQVKDFYVQMNQTDVQDSVDIEAYPKAGAASPDVLVYDVAAGRTTTIDVRDGRSRFDNTVVGHYVYGVAGLARWRELLPSAPTAASRSSSWWRARRDRPVPRRRVQRWLRLAQRGIDRAQPVARAAVLADGKRFIWESERNGWKNYYLYDLAEAAQSDYEQFHLRSQRDRQDRRSEERALLHGATATAT